MKTELNKYNNDVSALIPLTEFNYENIFKVYLEGSYYSYNILKKINFPSDIDEKYFDNVEITKKMSWTNISYQEYGTILLWWLICAINNIQNPTTLLESGKIIKIVKPQYVSFIIDIIKAQLNT